MDFCYLKTQYICMPCNKRHKKNHFWHWFSLAFVRFSIPHFVVSFFSLSMNSFSTFFTFPHLWHCMRFVPSTLQSKWQSTLNTEIDCDTNTYWAIWRVDTNAKTCKQINGDKTFSILSLERLGQIEFGNPWPHICLFKSFW